jgi:hypothetical protein
MDDEAPDYDLEAAEGAEGSIDEGLEEETTSEEPTDEFDLEADAALNTALPMSERRVALKNAIMACMGSDYGAPKEKKGGDDMLSTLLGGG